MPSLFSIGDRLKKATSEAFEDIKFGFSKPKPLINIGVRRNPQTAKLEVKPQAVQRSRPQLSLSQKLQQQKIKVGGAVGGAFLKADVATQKFFEPKPQLRARDIARELVQTAGKGAMAFNQGVVAAGVSLAQEAAPKTFGERYQPQGQEQILLGKQPIERVSIRPRVTKTKEFLQKHGFSEQTAGPTSLALGVGLTLAEADPRLGAVGKAGKLPKAFTSKWGGKILKNTIRLMGELESEFSKVAKERRPAFSVGTKTIEELKKGVVFEDDIIEQFRLDRAHKMLSNADIEPVVISPEGRVLDGRHRILEAEKMGIDELPVLIQGPPGSARAARPTLRVRGKYAGSEPAKFAGLQNLTTKTVEQLKGRRTVSAQFISDLIRRQEITKPEKEVIQRVLQEMPSKVNVKQFAEKVQAELLPLEHTGSVPVDVAAGDVGKIYENVSLPPQIRGAVENYYETIYTSPIKNSAGDIHFGGTRFNDPIEIDNYFAHIRTEEMADGKTRRVIEIQSDLFQKGRLERELASGGEGTRRGGITRADEIAYDKRVAEVAKLEPYSNRWHERILKEEIRRAAADGKKTLRFPTGETAMRVEGLGSVNQRWHLGESDGGAGFLPAEYDKIKVGQPIYDGIDSEPWIVTSKQGYGKFKAVPENSLDQIKGVIPDRNKALEFLRGQHRDETFDISGMVDTNNPIYKFYENDVRKYLQRIRGDVRTITDEQGVTWFETSIKAIDRDAPVEAFGAVAGFEMDDEGNVTFDPKKAAIGLVAINAIKGKGLGKKPLLGKPAKLPNQEKYAFNINKTRMSLDAISGKKLDDSVVAIKGELEAVRGRTLSNDEVVEAAVFSDMARKVIPVEETKRLEAALLRARQAVVAGAKDPKLTPEYLEALRVVSSQAAHAGRMLQSHKIGADAIEFSVREEMLQELFDLGHGVDELLKAAEGVDFNDARQATKFYREFVKPSAFDYLNEYRYMNLLSSPLTHIVNALSNTVQAGLLAPGTMLANGTIDFIGRGMTGQARTAYMTEVPAYYKGSFNSLGAAFKGAWDAIKGQRAITQLDIKHIPTGLPGMNVVPRILEAGDVFFRTLIEGGMNEALLRRAKMAGGGINQVLMDKQAQEASAYYTFRKPLDINNKTGQGYLLTAIDNFTNGILQVRSNKYTRPVVSWFVPFVTTPTNILKQGIEYSPLGVLTVPGAAKKQEQLGKAMIGSMVFSGAGYMAMRGDSTWSAPRGEDEKAYFYASGRKPYSLKVGDEWIPYTKLGPLAYPIAMAAAIKHYSEDNPAAVTDSKSDMITKILSGWAQFFSDQSYMQSMGDLFDTLSGDPRALQGFKSNIPRQLIPFTSLLGWVSRIVDPVFRDSQTSLDRIKIGLPFLSKDVTPFLEPGGDPSERKRTLLNSLFPFAPSETVDEYESLYQELLQQKRDKLLGVEEKESIQEQAEDLFESLRGMAPAEANQIVEGLSEEMYTELTKLTTEGALSAEDRVLRKYGVKNGKRAEEIFNRLKRIPTVEGRQAYIADLEKKKIISKNVKKQLEKLRDDEVIRGSQQRAGYHVDSRDQTTGLETQAASVKVKDYFGGGTIPEDEFAEVLYDMFRLYLNRDPKPAEIGVLLDEHIAGKSMNDIEAELMVSNIPNSQKPEAASRLKEAQTQAMDITQKIWGSEVNLGVFMRIKSALQQGKPIQEVAQQEQKLFARHIEMLPGDRLEAAPPMTPGRVAQQVKDMLPNFFDSSFEKATRREVAELYPFSDEVKAILPEIEVRDVSNDPKFLEGAAGTHAVARQQVVPQSVREFAMTKLPEALAARLPKSFYDGVGEPIGTIRLKDWGTNVMAHEVMHDVFDRTQFDLVQFNADWDQIKYDPGNEAMLDVDQIIFNHPVYSFIGDSLADAEEGTYGPVAYSVATERYAYLGEILGRKGLQAMPGRLQTYYGGVFRPTQEGKGIPAPRLNLTAPQTNYARSR